MKNKSDNFKKASVINITKYKIMWLIKVVWGALNKGFDTFIGWM